MIKKAVLFLFAVYFTGCGSFEPSVMQTSDADRQTIAILPGCEKYYENSDKTTVAVVKFQNNTTYADAKVSSSSSRSSLGAGVGYHSGGIGSSTNFDSISKSISSNLGEYAQGAVESMLVERGGINVVSRSQIDAILREQEFQMAMSDPNTAVEFGRLMGAQYIVAGSVDNINVSYKENTYYGSNMDGMLGLMLSMVDLYNSLEAGWNIETEMTINIIDVSTGKIIATSRSLGFANVGNSPNFAVDQVIAGSKKAMDDSLKRSTARMINDKFTVRGYVNELRGGKQAALLSIGVNDGIKKGDTIKIYELISITDFKTGKSQCQLSPLPFTMTVSEYVAEHSAWVKINTTKESYLEKLKVGIIAEKSPK